MIAGIYRPIWDILYTETCSTNNYDFKLLEGRALWLAILIYQFAGSSR